MPNITDHKFFVPVTTSLAATLSAISMTWYIAGLFSAMDVRLSVLESLLQQHISHTLAMENLWTKANGP